MKKFLIKLNNSEYEESFMCCVETNKTLKEFEQAYKRIREEWYANSNTYFCLWEYLQEKLAEEGFDFYEEAEAIELDF